MPGDYDAIADAVHAHSSDCNLPPVFSDNHKTVMTFKRKPLCNFHAESNLLRITVFVLWFPSQPSALPPDGVFLPERL